MRRMIFVLGLAALVSVTVGAQAPTALAGRWVLDAPAGPAMVDAAWEEWTVTDATATLRRADRPAVTETYATDGASHAVSRVANDGRTCRTTATATDLTIVCQAAPAGPGGMTLALETREVRTVGTDGRLTVETSWTSGGQTSTRRAVYRRQP
jgi:hypothetical protein